MNKEEILNTFLLANSSEIITQEEFDDVKKAIFKMLKENKILKENSYHNDKVVDKVNWENQLLRKQLEAINEQVDYLRSIERKEETIIDLQNEIVPYINEYIAKLEKEQKEFVKCLEDKINKLQGRIDKAIKYLEEPNRDSFDYSKAKLLEILKDGY